MRLFALSADGERDLKDVLAGILPATGYRPLFFDDRPDIVMLARDARWDASVFDKVEDVLRHPRLEDLL